MEIEFRPDALSAIARKALKRKTGARGLRTIVESVLLVTMYELPSLENVSKVVVDESVIEHKSEPYLIYQNPPAPEGGGGRVTTGSGNILVTLKPSALTTAQWRVLGETEADWRNSDAVLTGLPPGNYLIECKPVSGRATPPNVNITVTNGQTATTTITYFLADAATGTPPAVLSFESVSTDTTRPFAHVGQFRSQLGSSSGFVVKPRVVAMAAHVVWDNGSYTGSGSLSTVQGLQWLFQRYRGVHEPKPLIPRGFYSFDGYAAQRIAGNSPGDSSPASQHRDVAAVYFNTNAGRGGYAGFLASDLAQNEFLLSNANKMLVGYPIDGISPTSQGRMHATAPFNVVFSTAFGRTFTTSSMVVKCSYQVMQKKSFYLRLPSVSTMKMMSHGAQCPRFNPK